MSGLLINRALYAVTGVTIIGPHDAEWAHLSAGDCKPRTRRPTQVVLHKTIADFPERVLSGHGHPGHAKRTADYWRDDPKHSGAHIVIGDDVTACLADLALIEAYHANQANYRSVGIELCEEQGGVVRDATLVAGVAVCLALAEQLGIQMQCPRPGSYKGVPLKRYADGGSTLVGFFGHRDVTADRDVHDPGDEIFRRLMVAGFETFDFASGEDVAVWKGRQQALNLAGYSLVVDGIPGPATTAALRAEGYSGGVYALGRAR